MTVPEQTALAIVGMSCRLPGADSIDAYWRLISEGRCAIAQLPANRFDRELYYHVEKGVRGKSYTSLGALATWPDCDFLPQDKKGGTDPAHVSFCQVAAEAFRDAGLDPNVTSERTTGVYVGHTSGTAWNGAIAHASLIEQTAGWLRDVEGYDEVAGSQSEQIIVEIVERVRSESPHRLNEVTPFLGAIQIALLVAKALKLNGPAMAINAACASSLMALSVAARALDQRQIDTAIVGGTSYLKPDGLILFSKAQSVSATGSRPFDEHADGLIVGEGCAALVIRRLDAAMADGNSIHAIIRGVGISSDGKGKSLWAPRKEGQMEAMRRAYGSNMDVQRLGYVEAHATSTQVGDATELSALSEVLQERQCRKIPVGSVKANIGHTLETAGVAGLLKAVLALKHRQIPPTINVRQPNSKIDWNASPLFLPTELQNWPAPSDPRTGRALPRQAAVNSFGIGGLNAHVVLDEFVSDQLLVDSLANPARIVPSKRPDSVPIAVIGAAAIFSQAANLDAFQSLLRDGRNVRSDVPSRRWNSELACRPNQLPLWKVVNTRGGFITDYEYDWRKHKVPPKQVANADPLQFMLLDAVDQALHDAGYEDKIISRERTGVVIGNIFGGDFSAQLQMGLRLPVFRQMLLRQLRSHCLDSDRINAVADAYESLLLERMPALLDETGSYSTSTLASRIAKTFNLMGGAFAIDAGNASSFAALSACMDSLRGYHCDLMICAAGQRSMDLVTYQNLSRSGVLVDSATGEINEEVLPAEGAGVLLLKRLEDAERDGDRIRAVVDSSQLSCHDELHAAIRMACCHVASTDLAKNGAEQMVRIETSFSGRSLEPSVKIDALRSIFGTEMEKQFSMNAIARQFGNVAAAAGIASMLKAIVDIDVRSPPKTIYCFAANVAPVGRLHQAACVKLKPWRPPTVCRNAHDASESFPVLDVFGSPYDMGYEHGRCLKDAIRKALKRHADLAGWSKGAPAELELWAGRTDAWFDATQLEEMNGIADGANVALASIVAHNLRLAADISGGGCVHAVLPETSMGLLHGANEDLPVSLSIKDCLQRQVQRRTLSSGEQYVTFGIAGQVCGINGMNTAGITVTSAMLLNRPVPKQPSKLHCVLVQRLLEKAVDIPDAVRMVEDFAPLSASAWGLWLTHAAAGESLLIEYDRHECRTRAATHETSTCAANHCQLLPATTTAKAHSLARFTRLKQLLSSVKASDDPLSGLQGGPTGIGSVEPFPRSDAASSQRARPGAALVVRDAG